MSQLSTSAINEAQHPEEDLGSEDRDPNLPTTDDNLTTNKYAGTSSL